MPPLVPISVPAGSPLTGPVQLTLYAGVPFVEVTVIVPSKLPLHKAAVFVALAIKETGCVIVLVVVVVHPFKSVIVIVYAPLDITDTSPGSQMLQTRALPPVDITNTSAQQKDRERAWLSDITDTNYQHRYEWSAPTQAVSADSSGQCRHKRSVQTRAVSTDTNY